MDKGTNNRKPAPTQEHQQQQSLTLHLSKKKDQVQNWDSYYEVASLLSVLNPEQESIRAVVVIDESVRRRLGKLYISQLIEKITSPEMNCYVDLIPTGTSDNDVIKVSNSYANIPAIILTSDKDLCGRLRGNSLYIKAIKESNRIRIITDAIKYKLSRL
jgi:hypothetical protein